VLQSKVSSFEPELIKSLPKEHLFVANKCLFAMEKGLFALNKHSFATKETFDRSKQMFVGDKEGFVCHKQIFICDKETSDRRKQMFVGDEEGFVCHKQTFISDEQSFDRRKQMFIGGEESLVLIVMSSSRERRSCAETTKRTKGTRRIPLVPLRSVNDYFFREEVPVDELPLVADFLRAAVVLFGLAFLPPPVSLLTVAHARASAVRLPTPRFSYPSSMCSAMRFCLGV